MTSKICLNCGNEFTSQAAKFCSRKCAGLNQRTIKNCEYCHKEFIQKKQKRFCGHECARLASIKPKPLVPCSNCGKSLSYPLYKIKKQKLFFCNNQCQSEYWNKNNYGNSKTRRANRRQRLIQQSISIIVNAKEIYMRDGWKCKLCKISVKKNAKVPHPMAPTLDHIIPLAEGGTHEPKNLQCAHFACNTFKGLKAEQDQLRIF